MLLQVLLVAAGTLYDVFQWRSISKKGTLSSTPVHMKMDPSAGDDMAPNKELNGTKFVFLD